MSNLKRVELVLRLRDERRKKSTCLIKRPFETKEAVYQKGQKAYHCPYCGKWHRSGKEGRERRKKR